MKKDTYIGIGALVIILAGCIGYAALKPVPATAPGTASTNGALPEGAYVEHAQYYDIAANYATSTPLSGEANAAAVRAMKTYVGNVIGQFKTDGNFANLSANDIKTMGFDKGRKETLQVMYLIASSPRTVSYIFSTYEDTLGAHGNIFFHTFTFDTTTGALLSLNDVFSAGTNYLATLSTAARSRLPAVIGDGYDIGMVKDGTTPDEKNFQNFFFDNKDFVVLFDPYAVASYAAGPQTLRIPTSALSGLKTEYR